LVDTLSGPGPFTVFAPTNDAFGMIDGGVLGCLLEPDNKQVLTDVLLYHVASGEVTSDMLENNQKVSTLEGNNVTVTITDGVVMINEATVTTANAIASNGVVHVIDQVLLPPNNEGLNTLVEKCKYRDIPGTAVINNLDTLVTALTAADLVDTLAVDGPFTVFAPTDAAFGMVNPGVLGCLLESDNKQELTDVLLYHVASGNVASGDLTDNQKVPTLEGSDITITVKGTDVLRLQLKANDALILGKDVIATNGVVHVIDQVLIPSDNAGITALVERCTIPDIPALAVASNLDTLVTVLKAAGLVETLSGPGPFTVFAPTNAAFAKLDEGVLACLQEADNKNALAAVLKYHVASGEFTSDMLENNQKVSTLQGSNATVTISGSVVKINDATVMIADVSASNGVVHVIDNVLIPTNNDDVDDLIDKCATPQPSTASTILGVAIPLIGMLATAVAVIV